MPSCRALNRCTRTLPGTAHIYCDFIDRVYLRPGDWLVFNWELDDWLYAESDEDFRTGYWPMEARVQRESAELCVQEEKQ